VPSYFERLVKEMGLEQAKLHMAEIRTKRKKPGYFATLSKEELQEFQRKGVERRAKNKGKS
jgi:hypothetical protein